LNQVIKEAIISGRQLQLVQGDITEEVVDAIVNAANAHLQHGSGVAGAILRRGGPQIQAESNAWVREHGPVSHTEPAYTRAGSLPCRYVIHAVGPRWGEGAEDSKLYAAITGCLQAADHLSLTSIALPAISTGIFGFPKDRAAGVILPAIKNYLEKNPGTPIKLVRMTIYDAPTLEAFTTVWELLFASSG
jgi:O-acetyl-ADP-ribose deacetylase (regulator of RNase III)